MKTLKLKHNLNEVELEEALEKTLKGIKLVRETSKELPDKLANEMTDKSEEMFDNVISNMINEIKSVLRQK